MHANLHAWRCQMHGNLHAWMCFKCVPIRTHWKFKCMHVICTRPPVRMATWLTNPILDLKAHGSRVQHPTLVRLLGGASCVNACSQTLSHSHSRSQTCATLFLYLGLRFVLRSTQHRHTHWYLNFWRKRRKPSLTAVALHIDLGYFIQIFLWNFSAIRYL